MQLVTVIYIDVLIFVNIIVNYFLLRITAFFTGVSKRRGRTALAACAGSLFSLVVLLPDISIVFSLLIKIAGALVMSAAAFGIKSARHILKNTAYLFVASALLAGAVIAASEWSGSNALAAKNLGIYIDLSPLTLIIAVLVVYLLLCLFELLFKKHRKQDKTCRAKLYMGEKSLEFEAMMDSGNKLYDTLTGRDALILKKRYSKKLLTAQQCAALTYSDAGDDMAQHLYGIGDFALLPFRSVGGSGLLLGFGACSCEVMMESGKNTVIERPFVAFADDNMMGETDGIIGYDAVEV